MRNTLKEGIAYYKNRIVFDITDNRVVELLTRSYCYELMINNNVSQARALSVMKSDLENKLAITVNRVDREMDCYVLKKIDPVKDPKSENESAVPQSQIMDGVDSIRLTHLPMKRFLPYLYKYYPSLSLPLVYDEYGEDEISVVLPKTINDYAVLEKVLSTAGYRLTRGKRTIAVVEIK